MIPVLLAFILLMPLTASGQAGGNWLTYENEDLGFSIQYPPDWTIEEEGGGDLVNLRSNDALNTPCRNNKRESPRRRNNIRGI